MLAHALEQGRLDRGRIGAAVAAARKQDRAEAAAVRGADGAGGGIEARPRCRELMRSANSALDRRLVDRRGGEDAGAGRGAADLGDRQPGLARQRRGRIEPEAAAADAEPVGAGRCRAVSRRGRGRPERCTAPSSPLPPRRPGRSPSQRLARPRAASARLPFSLRQRRSRISRSASLPPRPRSESSTATSAAVSPQPRARPRSACGRAAAAAARRRWRGRAAVGAAVLVDRAEAQQALARLLDRGGRAADRASAGRADR